MALEIRWYFKEIIPSDVVSWFKRDARDDFLLPADKRRDIYVATRDEDIGVKLRQGKLEIKWRQKCENFAAAAGRAKGVAEYWHKWKWRDATSESQWGIIDALAWGRYPPWFEVFKERHQLKYRFTKDGFDAVTKDEKVLCGCAVELTMLRLRDEDKWSWWTLAAEIFEEEDKTMQMLQKFADTLFQDYPGPDLQERNSFGYPAWVMQVTRE